MKKVLLLIGIIVVGVQSQAAEEKGSPIAPIHIDLEGRGGRLPDDFHFAGSGEENGRVPFMQQWGARQDADMLSLEQLQALNDAAAEQPALVTLPGRARSNSASDCSSQSSVGSENGDQGESVPAIPALITRLLSFITQFFSGENGQS